MSKRTVRFRSVLSVVTGRKFEQDRDLCRFVSVMTGRLIDSPWEAYTEGNANFLMQQFPELDPPFMQNALEDLDKLLAQTPDNAKWGDAQTHLIIDRWVEKYFCQFGESVIIECMDH